MNPPSTAPAFNSPDEGWRQQLAQDPEGLAFDGPDERLTRLAFEALIAEEAAALREQGVAATDIVAWLGHNSPRMLAALLACERVGAVFMPLNWRLATDELLACLRHAGVAVLRGTPELETIAEPLRQALASDGPVRGAGQRGDLLLVYTSGTTGQPKGAMHTAAQLAANARAAIAVQGFSRAERVLAVLPLFHVGGLCIQLIPALLSGGVVRLPARFDPGAWLADVGHWRPTTSLMVPATIRAALDHSQWPAADLSSLRFLNSGSSVVPLAQIEAFHARGVPVTQVYGSTETGPFSIALRPDEARAHTGSVGHEAPGVQIRLTDERGAEVPAGEVGEIRVKGDNVMRGYHRAPDHPLFQDGWFRSGDLARRHPDGRYEVVGRSKDMIISGGENIYPAEIENLVIGLPEVAECAVVGLPDERWGEVPVLVVAAVPGVVIRESDLRAKYEHKLARFKHPKRIELLSELPKTALGKIRKDQLLAMLRK